MSRGRSSTPSLGRRQRPATGPGTRLDPDPCRQTDRSLPRAGKSSVFVLREEASTRTVDLVSSVLRPAHRPHRSYTLPRRSSSSSSFSRSRSSPFVRLFICLLYVERITVRFSSSSTQLRHRVHDAARLIAGKQNKYTISHREMYLTVSNNNVTRVVYT